MDPDSEGARDEDDRKGQSERRDEQQRLDIRYRFAAAAANRPDAPRRRLA